MKRFLTYTSIVAILVLLPLVGMEVYVEQQPNPSRNKHEWMLKHSGEVETLILGSSHTFYGLSPKEMGPHTFSLAHVSQTYRYDWELLRHYPMPRLKTVILPFSYFSPWEDLEQMDSSWPYAIRYRLYMDVDVHSRFSRYGLEMFSVNTLWEKMHALWQPAELTWDSLGHGTNFTLVKRAKEWDNGKERALANTYTDTYTDTSLVRLNYDYLSKMAAFCKERGIRFVLLTTPVTASFRQNEDARQIAVNRKFLHAVLQAYPDILYLNFEDDSRFTSEDFYDSDHLNENGAKKLSALVKQCLLASSKTLRQ